MPDWEIVVSRPDGKKFMSINVDERTLREHKAPMEDTAIGPNLVRDILGFASDDHFYELRKQIIPPLSIPMIYMDYSPVIEEEEGPIACGPNGCSPRKKS